MIMVDYRGKYVDYAVSFSDFRDYWFKDRFLNCYNFMSWGFMYEEPRLIGVNSTIVGFITLEDCLGYRRFISKMDLNDKVRKIVLLHGCGICLGD